jgi:hypothetical protein
MVVCEHWKQIQLLFSISLSSEFAEQIMMFYIQYMVAACKCPISHTACGKGLTHQLASQPPQAVANKQHAGACGQDHVAGQVQGP